MITESSSANHTAAMTAAIKGQMLFDRSGRPPEHLPIAASCSTACSHRRAGCAQPNQKKHGKKMFLSKCCGLLRAFAEMTEIANEPKPRSKLLRACELLESFIARHGVRRKCKTAR